jgi:hypothetical protein
MKVPLFSIALCAALSTLCLADEPKAPADPTEGHAQAVTGQDILPNVKLVVRADRGEKLTDDELGRMQLMVAYIKGFTDGLHPMQVMYPQGPVFIPESTTIGQFARNLEDYLTKDKQALTESSTLVLFNCAFSYYQNPNFNPQLMPKRVPVPPEMLPKK